MSHATDHASNRATNVIPIKGLVPGCGECKFTHECLALGDAAPPAPPAPAMRVPPRVIRRDTHIFRMGDRFDALYMVRSGAVKTYILSEEGEQQVTGFYLPGDVFGLDSIDGGSYACNAVTLDTSCLCVLAWEPLAELAGHDRGIQQRLLARLSRKVREDDRMILLLGQRSANERIATFLLGLAARQARLGFSPRTVHLPMSRGEMGSYLTLAVETVSRVLTRLQKQGLIAVDRNRIDLLDFDRLAAVAGDRRPEGLPFGAAAAAAH